MLPAKGKGWWSSLSFVSLWFQKEDIQLAIVA
jgi:hypothetical protein